MVLKARNIKDGLRDNKVKSVKERLEKDINTIRHEHQEALPKIKEQSKIDKINLTMEELETKYKNLISTIEQATNLDQYLTSSSSNVEGFKTLIASLIAKSPTGKKTKNIRISSLIPVANKKITSSQDVDKVIENIKKQLLMELSNNDELNLD
jgi:hypothetical protein